MNNDLTYIEINDQKYPIAYTLNVMEVIQNKYGSLKKWSDLIESKGKQEPDISALIFFFTEAINEGIDIENDKLGSSREFIDKKKAGRIISTLGFQNAGEKLKNIVIQSSNVGSDSEQPPKNEKTTKIKNQ